MVFVMRAHSCSVLIIVCISWLQEAGRWGGLKQVQPIILIPMKSLKSHDVVQELKNNGDVSYLKFSIIKHRSKALSHFPKCKKINAFEASSKLITVGSAHKNTRHSDIKHFFQNNDIINCKQNNFQSHSIDPFSPICMYCLC